MATPKAYAAMRQREAEDEVASKAEADRINTIRAAEESALFKKISKALREYNKADLDGHHIFVINNSIKNYVDVFVDKTKWLTFLVKRTFHYCSHDYQCDCSGPDTSISMDVIQHKKDGDYHPYFACSDRELQDEDKLAEAMADMIRDFEWMKCEND